MGASDIARGESHEDLIKSIGSKEMRTAAKTSGFNRMRKFTGEGKHIFVPLVPVNLADKVTELAKTTVAGTEALIEHDAIIVVLIPTVPDGYPGDVPLSLEDSGLAEGLRTIPEQEATMLIGAKAKAFCFYPNYSIPVSDKGRCIGLKLDMENVEMASPGMSPMVGYIFWKWRVSGTAVNFKHRRIEVTSILPIDGRNHIQDEDQLRHVIQRAIKTEAIIVGQKRVHAPRSINLIRGPKTFRPRPTLPNVSFSDVDTSDADNSELSHDDSHSEPHGFKNINNRRNNIALQKSRSRKATSSASSSDYPWSDGQTDDEIVRGTPSVKKFVKVHEKPSEEPEGKNTEK